MFFFLRPIKWAVELVVLLILAAAAYVVFCAVGVVRAESGGSPAADASPSAIVVTGAAAADGAPDADLLRRLQGALTLARAHAAPAIVLAAPGTAVAGGARWLAAHGYRGQLQQESGTGATSFSRRSLPTVGPGKSVIIVTDAVDARFALDAAAASGLHPSVSVVPGSKKPIVDDLGPLLREASAIAAGHVIGYGRVSWAAS